MVIALEVNRSGLTFVTVDSAARNAGNLLIVNAGDMVQDNSDIASDQSYVVRVPGIRRNWSFEREFEEAVDGAHRPSHIRTRCRRSV